MTKKTMDSGKKVLLFTPKRPPPGTSPLHYGDFRPPLGLGFLAAYLERYGHEARIIDNYLQEQNTEEAVNGFAPDFIGIYTHTASYLQVLELIEEIRKITDKPIICGGPHATVLPETIPDTVSHIVIGEGEVALLGIVKGEENGRIIQKPPVGDLDSLPWPSYKHFIDKPYNFKMSLYSHGHSHGPQMEAEPVLTMNTSRGCPFGCTFCGVCFIWGRAYRFFSAGKIVEEVENLVNTYGAKGIYFREDNFTLHRKRLEEFCDSLLERNIKIHWACESRVDAIQDEALMEKVFSAGCRGFYVGVESGEQRVLDLMEKGVTVGQIKRFFALCRKASIKTYATFCMGTPGETDEDREETNRLIEEIQPDSVDRFAYVGIPKSAVYEYILENQLYYHIDRSGFLYTEESKRVSGVLYEKGDSRLVFLENQERMLGQGLQ